MSPLGKTWHVPGAGWLQEKTGALLAPKPSESQSRYQARHCSPVEQIAPATSGVLHVPVEGLHVPVAWQGSAGAQLTA